MHRCELLKTCQHQPAQSVVMKEVSHQNFTHSVIYFALILWDDSQKWLLMKVFVSFVTFFGANAMMTVFWLLLVLYFSHILTRFCFFFFGRLQCLKHVRRFWWKIVCKISRSSIDFLVRAFKRFSFQ